MCQHIKPPTYFHVIDEDNGEHIATYQDPREAYRRAVEEAADHERYGAKVVTL